MKERYLDRCDLYLFISEKEVGALAFPLSSRGFDYLGFCSEGGGAHGWSREIFLHYWNATEELMVHLDRLENWIRKRPRVLNTFKRIAEGKPPLDRELISDLEDKGFLIEGKPTLLGMTVLYRPVLREQKRRMK